MSDPTSRAQSRARPHLRRLVAAVTVVGTALVAPAPGYADSSRPARSTATPIEHLVVIFQENVSFDHYFGTYPNAANADGTPFHARPGTPTVNGLTEALRTANPNSANPQRLPSTMPLTCDQGHTYGQEQKAFDAGLMDAFIPFTAVESCNPPAQSVPGLVMDYYDGNTVTALWNYAQYFAMSDNSFASVFGPSTPGALNLIAGQTHGGYAVTAAGERTTDPQVVSSPDASGVGTVILDPDPAFEDCTFPVNHLVMQGRNIGDLLNTKNVTWGWFQGGFKPTSTTNGTAVCGAAHANVGGAVRTDYNAHHQPFQYYASTANPHHLPPSSVASIGHTDQANHQYDLSDFQAALTTGNLPSVSFLKAANYQDGHAGYSDPIDEQHFLVDTINALQRSTAWKSTAVVIAYDDSDGWYDHVAPPILNTSHDPQNDSYNASGHCGAPNKAPRGGYADRCGYGPRLPLLVISPFARTNFVDHALTDQTSVLRFIEDNWNTGRIGDSSFDELAGPLTGMFDFRDPHLDPVILNPGTGAVVRH